MELDNYEDDSESETTEVVKKTRNPTRNRKWKLEKVFENTEEGEEAVINEKTWGFHFSNSTFEGKRKYFRCNKVKYRGKQCDAGVHLFYDATNEKVVLFRSAAAHTHDSMAFNKSGPKMSPELQQEIKKLFNLKIKPKEMMEELESSQFDLPTMSQLRNYLTKIKTEKYGSTKLSLGELEQWCLDSSQNTHEMDSPFVVAHKMEYGDEFDDEFDDNEDVDEDEDGDEDSMPKFRYFVSTRRLLANASTCTNIHADATYKLIWQGFPVLVVGTTDLDRHFHPFGMAICSKEEEKDFKFTFESLAAGVEKYSEQEMDPQALIADSSNAIRNAFKDTFGEKTMVMCWAHVRRNVEKKVQSLVEKSAQNEIMQDIEVLQLSQSRKIFLKASKLFLKKWKGRQPAFITYFENQWLKSHNLWYEGVDHFTPSTNNGLESFNRVIKDKYTLRERLPMSRFRILSLEAVQRWSTEYANNTRVFKNKPTITLDLWTQGYIWAKTKKSVKSVEVGDKLEYTVPSGDSSTISESDLEAVKKLKWNTFDQFKEKAFSLWIVTTPKEKSLWENGICTCPAFFKKYMCKHVVGLGIRTKSCRAPIAAKNRAFQPNKRRGRPTKARLGLVIQR
jgi:hypothetical protein